jgi:hypothetical protein
MIKDNKVIDQSVKKETALVSFYRTPLVCGAAPEIGCGSRSKPLLAELESSEAVKSAWLNRVGTMIAIEWQSRIEDRKKDALVKELFIKHQVEYSELKDQKEAGLQFTSFNEKKEWYRGDKVDELSLEEAGIIAQNIVAYLVKDEFITKDQAAKMKLDMETYFKQELVKVRTKDELYSDDLRNEWNSKVVAIGENYTGAGKMASSDKIKIWQTENKSCEENDACCEKATKKASCCSPQ